MNRPPPHREDTATLVPKRPPGRGSRKARAFASEIGRLHALGYTFEAIREALADAGVHVSKSTVQREAARCATAAPATPPQPAIADEASAQRRQPEAISGKDIAEAFVRGRITNRLIREKDRS